MKRESEKESKYTILTDRFPCQLRKRTAVVATATANAQVAASTKRALYQCMQWPRTRVQIYTWIKWEPSQAKSRCVCSANDPFDVIAVPVWLAVLQTHRIFYSCFLSFSQPCIRLLSLTTSLLWMSLCVILLHFHFHFQFFSCDTLLGSCLLNALLFLVCRWIRG